MKAHFTGLKIAGIASVIPSNEVKITSYNEAFGEKKVKRISKSTGVESVHIVSKGETASDLCYIAAKSLISELKIDSDGIDAILFVSFSPDYKSPATAIILQDRLGLSREVVAMDITFGCSAYVYGLYQASLLLKAGGCSRVLLCTGDTQSMMVNPKDRSMRMLVGDAGTATIVENGTDTFNFYLKCDGSGNDNIRIDAGGYRNPSTEETRVEIADEDGNIRSMDDLHMQGMEVMKFALTEVPLAVDNVLQIADIDKEKVSLYAMHQPNKMILDSLCLKMDLGAEKMPVGLKNTGNTSAASIPLLLSTLASNGYDFASTEDVIACGFGVGLSIGAVNIKLNGTKILPVRKV